MFHRFNQARRRLQVFLIVVMALSAQAFAQGPVLVIKDDPGGGIAARLAQIEQLRASGQRVEIRSGHCMSSCTLYLGLSQTCVGRRAVFGFHGPSSSVYGLALPPKEFDYWSQRMAEQYPPALRGWFLKTGRHKLTGFYRLSGAQLIKMGIAECT